MSTPVNESIKISLPVKIRYTALEKYLNNKLVGKTINREDESGKLTNYAEMLSVSLANSLEEGYDLAADIKIKMLTSLFRNREADLLLDIALAFDHSSQEVSVRDYKLDLETGSWLVSNSLEAVVNSFLYEKLKQKMRFDFKPIIQEQLGHLNAKLESPMEAYKGVFLSGFLQNFRITDLIPGKEVLLALVEVEAKALVDVQEMDF